jgi:hypothetical protein
MNWFEKHRSPEPDPPPEPKLEMDEHTLASLRAYATKFQVIVTITIDNVGNVTTNLVEPETLGRAIDADHRRRKNSWLRDTPSGSGGYRA